MNYIDEVLAKVKEKNAAEPEFLQAVEEVLESIRPVVEANEDLYRKEAILERITTPDRQFIFRVPWVDDKGQVQVNTGSFHFFLLLKTDDVREINSMFSF